MRGRLTKIALSPKQVQLSLQDQDRMKANCNIYLFTNFQRPDSAFAFFLAFLIGPVNCLISLTKLYQ